MNDNMNHKGIDSNVIIFNTLSNKDNNKPMSIDQDMFINGSIIKPSNTADKISYHRRNKSESSRFKDFKDFKLIDNKRDVHD